LYTDLIVHSNEQKQNKITNALGVQRIRNKNVKKKLKRSNTFTFAIAAA
jgi:hypothetical protein